MGGGGVTELLHCVCVCVIPGPRIWDVYKIWLRGSLGCLEEKGSGAQGLDWRDDGDLHSRGGRTQGVGWLLGHKDLGASTMPTTFGFCLMPECGMEVMDMFVEQLTFKGLHKLGPEDLNSDHEGPQLKDLLMGHESPRKAEGTPKNDQNWILH